MKNSNEQTLKEVILALIEEYRLKDGLQESRLISSWDNIAGKFIASNTESIYIRKKNLYIKLNSAALKHELLFAKSDLINSLNKSVGQEVITDIIFL
jgi:hypothetical protein